MSTQTIPPLRAPQGNFGRVEQALRDTIRLFHAQGRLQETDHALVAYLVSTAAVVDDGKAGAIMRKEYREALQALILRCERDSGNADILSGVFAAVGDPQTAGTVLLRAAGSGDRPTAGDAVHALAVPGGRRRPGAAA